VIDEVCATGVVASRLESDLELRPDTVRRGDQNRLAIGGEVRPEEPSESADVSENPRREGRPDDVPRACERRGFGVDVDAGGCVTGGFQGARL
jgi:hypothetical protein